MIGQALDGGIDGFVLDTCGGAHELGIPDNLVKAAEAIGGGFQIGLCWTSQAARPRQGGDGQGMAGEAS